MIYIKENIAKKVPGITSLFVTFDYNSEIIEVIKKFSCKNYSKQNKVWEFPVTYLSDLLDQLCLIDDIDLSLHDMTFKEDCEYSLMNYKTKPFPHQIEAIQYGLNHNKWLLLHDAGLGKTLSIICLAQELKKRDNIKHCLIICGINSLKTNWKKEIEKHSNLSAHILGEYTTKTGKIRYDGNSRKLEQLQKGIKEFFVIVNIEALRDKKIIKELVKQQDTFPFIVVDEIHTCKSIEAEQTKNLLKLTKAKYIIGATGTIMLNKPLDVFVPLRFIGADHSTASNFKNYYCILGGPFNNEVLGYHNLDTIKTQLSLFAHRRTKDILNLPEKTVINEMVDMTSEQESFYKDIENGVKEAADKINLSDAAFLSLIIRLRQATACPSILTSNNIISAKVQRALQLTKQLIETGNKVVIFSTFKDTVKFLEEQLKEYKPLTGTGDTEEEVLSKNIDLFQTDSSYPIFIGTWQKCGTGITLNKASYMIFIDTPWTSGAFSQACDRIHRIGTKEPVFIYNLITTNTIDEKVHEILESKSAISEYLIDNKLDVNTKEILKRYIKDIK